MSATDELLTLLKEQGVEHYKHEVPAEENCVAFYDGERWHDCWESVDGEVNVTFSMTPEQAIAATVGSGTIDKAAERIEVLSGFAREYLHRYGFLMSATGEDVTDEVLAIEQVINEVCERKVVDE